MAYPGSSIKHEKKNWMLFTTSVIITDDSESIGTPKVLALAIKYYCKIVVNKVMPAIQFDIILVSIWYYFGNSFEAQFGSLTYHIVSGIC